MSELLRVESLKKYFPLTKTAVIVAVNGVSFSIGHGETLGLVGESGSGKTTVGRCILRTIEPSAGSIFFDGVDITRCSQAQFRSMRHRIQLVFQEPFSSLNPRRSIGDTVEEPVQLQGVLNRHQRRQRVREVFDAVQLPASDLDRFPAELTASAQQRAGIARALVTRPDLIVLDEPTSNLDPSVAGEILDLLIAIQEEFGASYLFISHDLTAVERVSHRIAIMYLGRIVELASTHDILETQYQPYSRALLSAVLYPDPHQHLEPFVLEGEIPSPINPPDECPLASRCPLVQPGCRSAAPPLEPVAPDHVAACYRSGDFVTGRWTGRDQLRRPAKDRPEEGW